MRANVVPRDEAFATVLREILDGSADAAHELRILQDVERRLVLGGLEIGEKVARDS
jgi:hypothetical protein